VVREVEAEFAAYYQALAANDIAVLNRFFFDSPDTIRYGNAEVLYGYERSRPIDPPLPRRLRQTLNAR
jgi:Protein of unknown function (DUF3225)